MNRRRSLDGKKKGLNWEISISTRIAMTNAANMKWQEYTELIAKLAAKNVGSLCTSYIFMSLSFGLMILKYI